MGLSSHLYLTFVVVFAPAVAFLAWGDRFLRTYSRECVEQRIPEAEGRLGFQFGSLLFSGEEKSQWALVEITDGGALSKVGFRSGDIPTSITAFCAALSADESSAKEERTVVVVNAVDWNSEDSSKWRDLTIPGTASHE